MAGSAFAAPGFVGKGAAMVRRLGKMGAQLATGLMLLLAALPGAAAAQAAMDGDAALAQQLANPVASLISIPLQQNFDWGGGPRDDAFRYQLNIQPVVPMTLSSRTSIISRTILPILHQRDLTAPGAGQTGLGDMVQSLFFSPKAPTPGGVVWGAGPVLLVPTATDRALGTGKFGMGPTAVLPRIDGQWTHGALVNQIWSVAGKADRADVSATFVQPFLVYTTRTATTCAINTETSHDWVSDRTLVPINMSVAQLVKLGGLPVQLGLAGRIHAVAPASGPKWGLRFTTTVLLPR